MMSMTPDQMNACFELAGAAITSLSVKNLLEHKEVKGVSLWPSLFFTSWGVWNLFYYSGLNQPYSTAAGGVMMLVNLTWLSLATFYTSRNRRNAAG